VLLTSTAVGIAFAVTKSISAPRRDDFTLLATFLWAIGWDALILDPIKAFILHLAHRRVSNPALEAAVIERSDALRLRREAKAARRAEQLTQPRHRQRTKALYEDEASGREEETGDPFADALTQVASTRADDFETVVGLEPSDYAPTNETVWEDVDFDNAVAIDMDDEGPLGSDFATVVGEVEDNTAGAHDGDLSEASALESSREDAESVISSGTPQRRSEYEFTPRTDPDFQTADGTDALTEASGFESSELRSNGRQMSEATLDEEGMFTAQGSDEPQPTPPNESAFPTQWTRNPYDSVSRWQ
jgi:hypothetical protein